MRGLDSRIKEMQADEVWRIAALSARFGGEQTPRRQKRAIYSDLVYRQHDHKTSWLRDLVQLQIGRDDTGECRTA